MKWKRNESEASCCRCAGGAFSFPIGKFIGHPRSTRISHLGLFPLYTIRFSLRPSGSETAVPHRDLFEWFASQSGPLVKFLLASTFFAPILPLLLLFLRRFLSSSFSAFSPIPLTDLRSKADSHGRSAPLCTFQKCPEAAPGVTEARR